MVYKLSEVYAIFLWYVSRKLFDIQWILQSRHAKPTSLVVSSRLLTNLHGQLTCSQGKTTKLETNVGEVEYRGGCKWNKYYILKFLWTCWKEVYGMWNGLPASREAISLTIIWRLPIVCDQIERPPILYLLLLLVTCYFYIYVTTIYVILFIYQVIHYILSCDWNSIWIGNGRC